MNLTKLVKKIRHIITGQVSATLSKTEWQKVEEALQFQNERRCVYCNCTDDHACPQGCHWLEKHVPTNTGVCSACATVEKFPEGIVMLRITSAPRYRPTQKKLALTHLNLTKL